MFISIKTITDFLYVFTSFHIDTSLISLGLDMSNNHIQIEVKVYRGTKKLFIRKYCENLLKGRSVRTKSLDIDEWIELKKVAQTIDDHLFDLNLSQQSVGPNKNTSISSLSGAVVQKGVNSSLKVALHNEGQYSIDISKDKELQNNNPADEENTEAIAELLAILQENEQMFNEQ